MTDKRHTNEHDADKLIPARWEGRAASDGCDHTTSHERRGGSGRRPRHERTVGATATLLPHAHSLRPLNRIRNPCALPLDTCEELPERTPTQGRQRQMLLQLRAIARQKVGEARGCSDCDWCLAWLAPPNACDPNAASGRAWQALLLFALREASACGRAMRLRHAHLRASHAFPSE